MRNTNQTAQDHGSCLSEKEVDSSRQGSYCEGAKLFLTRDQE